MAKTFHVTMNITIEEEAVEDLQRITHHVEELLDLDNWSEIQNVSDVTCEEIQ